MFKCPACGAEHPAPYDVCAVCGAPFDADIIDPFAAAMEQEAKSRAEQEKLREKYRKRSEQTQKKESASPNENPKKQSAQKSAKRSAAELKRRERNMKLTAAAIIAIILLTVCAITAITNMIRVESGDNGLFRKRINDRSYAFYQKDNSLWYYDAPSGECLCLIEQMTDLFPADDKLMEDDALALLMSVSEDGSRVFYPKASDHKDTALLCWRALDDFSNEHVVSEISLRDINPIASAMQHEITQGNPDQMKSADFINMMPAYIVLGDAVFYRNAEEMLCRRSADGEETVLASKVARFWTIPESNLVYYLMPLSEVDMFAYEIATSQIGIAFYEECTVPCELYTCAAVGTPAVTQNSSICAWTVPETDSARWFHYTERTNFYFTDSDNPDVYSAEEYGCALLIQTDLLHPTRSEIILSSDVYMMPLHVLRCYPDGSFYYSMRTPNDALSEISFFKRSYDCSEPLVTVESESLIGVCAVCHDEPYLLAQTADGTTELFHGAETAELTLPDAVGDAVYSFAYGGTELYCKYRNLEQSSLYIGKPNGSEPVTMQKMLGFDAGAVYFGVTATGVTQYFNWSTDGGDRLSACDDRGVVHGVIWSVRFYQNADCIMLCPQYGQLYCLGDYAADSGTLRRWENSRFDDIAESVTDYIPLDADRLYLFSGQSGKLLFFHGKDSFCADTEVTRLICAGTL